jgi:hypothetical protein
MGKFVDITGQRFGILTAIKRVGTDSGGCVLWLFKCDCGNERIVSGRDVKRRKIKSCGCLYKNKFIDITGKRFGKLVAVEKVGHNNQGNILWLFQCDCGNTIITHIRHRRVKSCGCLKTTHGQSKNRIYTTWWNMYRRCYDQKDKSYSQYGEKGIKVCDEWRNNKQSFFDWAMSNGYTDSLTLDRIDGKGSYCPDNCRWATPKEQAINRITTTLITYNGTTKSVHGWAEHLKTYSQIITDPIKQGVPPEEAVRRAIERLSNKTG